MGPKVSGELAYAGVLSVVLASFAMLLYIWFRFEWPFAVGAIATLILDVTKCVGFFALTGLDFNLTAIAALLTLIGYSVNDKVVVYDRMRENMRLYKAMPFREMIDKSINETLARSLYTSITAFLALLADGGVGRKRGRELRGADGVRHRDRGELVGVHRGPDPLVPGRLAQTPARGDAARSGGVGRTPHGRSASTMGPCE